MFQTTGLPIGFLKYFERFSKQLPSFAGYEHYLPLLFTSSKWQNLFALVTWVQGCCVHVIGICGTEHCFLTLTLPQPMRSPTTWSLCWSPTDVPHNPSSRHVQCRELQPHAGLQEAAGLHVGPGTRLGWSISFCFPSAMHLLLLSFEETCTCSHCLLLIDSLHAVVLLISVHVCSTSGTSRKW